MKAATRIVGLFRTTDQRVMLRFNRWHAPWSIRVYAVAATRGGDGWLWHLLGAAVAVFGGRERATALSSAALAAGAGITIFLWLKRRIGRPRPCTIEPHCWHHASPPDQFSFPSGHTITAFAVATAIGHYYPSLTPGLWFCASSVAISRVVLGMHFVTDVLVGAVIGTSLGLGSTATIGILTAAVAG